MQTSIDFVTPDLKQQLLRLIKKQYKKQFKKDFTEKSLNWILSLEYIYFLFDFVFEQQPLNDKTRIDSDKMQEIYLQLKRK